MEDRGAAVAVDAEVEAEEGRVPRGALPAELEGHEGRPDQEPEREESVGHCDEANGRRPTHGQLFSVIRRADFIGGSMFDHRERSV
jgi:hypothetical protein